MVRYGLGALLIGRTPASAPLRCFAAASRAAEAWAKATCARPPDVVTTAASAAASEKLVRHACDITANLQGTARQAREWLFPAVRSAGRHSNASRGRADTFGSARRAW